METVDGHRPGNGHATEPAGGTFRDVIDLTLLRDDEEYRAGAVRKGADEDAVAELLALDARRRELMHSTEALRARANAVSKEIGKSDPAERPARIAEASRLKTELGELESELARVSEEVTSLALTIPNPAHPSVPGGGEENFETVKEVGERTPAPAMDHATYGERMGFVDAERAVRNSGSRFAYIMGAAVQVEFALVQWTLAKLSARGFVPVVPPVLVREEMMVDAGFFPTDRNQVYAIEGDDLFLTGTSEVGLAGLHRGERIDEGDLPSRYVGFSTCFRREAGTYGKDTRGIFRVHQFDKVEMFSYVHPDRSWEELELLRELQEEIVSELGLPYRVINVAAGDLGPAAAKKYDLEVWLPSEGRYREITSCSNYTDYSARRMGTRMKEARGSRLLHTLNGTACAIARTLVFMFENLQEPDGTWVIPEPLRPFLGFDSVPPPG